MHTDVGENEKLNFEITDKLFVDLYESELTDYKGPEKGGACMSNTYRLAKYFESQGISTGQMRFLFLVSPTPVGADKIKPNTTMLRNEEQKKLESKGKNQTEWAYHAAVIGVDNKVYDLSIDKKYWGINLKDYFKKTFLDDRGYGNFNLRIVVSPIESVYEIEEKDESIAVTELVKRGNKIGAGMSASWMLEKPEGEWFIKPDSK